MIYTHFTSYLLGLLEEMSNNHTLYNYFFYRSNIN